MKVKELIEFLEKEDQEMEVRIYDLNDWDNREVDIVEIDDSNIPYVLIS
jgi:hypothetical protein